MNGKKSKIIITVVIIILAIIFCAVLLTQRKDKTVNVDNTESNNNQPVQEILTTELEDGTKVNISSEIKEASFNIDGLTISNIKLSELVNMTEITADVKNESEQTKGDIMVSIKLFDSSDTEIVDIDGYIDTLNPGGTSKLNATAPLDYSEAYSIQIEKR